MRDIQDPLPPDAEPEFVHDEEQDDVSKIQSLLKELDLSGGVARIFRQRPNQAKFEYVGEIAADGFSLETIKKAYGGGDYSVKFAAKGGRYVRGIRFSIDPRHKGEIDKLLEGPPVTQNNSNDNSQALLAFMMQQQQSQAQQAQQSMTLMMTMMAESQKSMAAIIAAAIGGRSQPEPSSRFIEVMMPMLTESMKPRGGISDVAETVKLAKELIGPPQEKEEKDDMLEKIMTVGAPLLGAFMSRGQQAPQAPRTVVPSTPPQPPALPTPEQMAQAKAQELLGQLRFVTPVLVRAAKKDSPIDSYVDILNDTLDDASYQMLVFMLQRDDWISTLFNDDPDVVANRQWFDNFREVILHPDEEPAGQAPASTEEVPKASRVLP
jgi:hypothetical protein